MKKLFFILLVFSVICARAQDRFALLEQQLENASKTCCPGLAAKAQISLSGSSLPEFLSAIGKSHDLNISVDPGIDIKIANNFKDVTVSDIFMFLCKRYDLTITFIGPIITFSKYVAPPVKEVKTVARRIGIAYDSTAALLSFELKNDSISAVVKEISRLTNKNVVFAPEVYGKLMNGYIQPTPLKSALEILAYSNDLKLAENENGLYILEKNVKATNNAGSTNNSFSSPSSGKNINGLNYKIENDLITLDAQNVPISDIISQVSNNLKQNYFLFNELKGNATLNVKEKNYEEFLKFLLNGTDFTFKKDGDIYLFGDRNLEMLRVSKLVKLQNRTIEKIMDFVPADLKKGVDVKVFSDLNGIIVSGSQPRINELETFLREIDLVVPNIYIEVIIAEVSKSNTLSAGITAGLGTKPADPTSGSVVPLDMSLNSASINNVISGLSGFTGINLGKVTPNFYMTIKALEENGTLKLRSTPQIATLNGNPAKISIGKTEYYLEVQNNIIQNVGQQNVLQSQQYKSVNADLSLSITPQVSNDEQITMDIEVKQSTFTARISNTAPPGTVNRDFKSLIRVKNGEMIMLGGLEENSNENSGKGLPGLSRVPVLRWLFGTRTKKKSESKLTIFIKPTVIFS